MFKKTIVISNCILIFLSNICYPNNQRYAARIRERINNIVEDNPMQVNHQDYKQEGQARPICIVAAIWLVVVLGLELPKVLNPKKNKDV